MQQILGGRVEHAAVAFPIHHDDRRRQGLDQHVGKDKRVPQLRIG
jgi:hypothetical protein